MKGTLYGREVLKVPLPLLTPLPDWLFNYFLDLCIPQ